MAEGAGYCSRERRQAHSPPDSACGQEIWILQKIQIFFPWRTRAPWSLLPGDFLSHPLEKKEKKPKPLPVPI